MQENSNKIIHISEISLRVKALIKNLKLKDKEFANQLEVGTGRLSNILSGRNKPDIEFVSSIVKKFRNVNSFWLLIGEGEMFLEEPKFKGSNQPIESTKEIKDLEEKLKGLNETLDLQRFKITRLEEDLVKCNEQIKSKESVLATNTGR